MKPLPIDFARRSKRPRWTLSSLLLLAILALGLSLRTYLDARDTLQQLQDEVSASAERRQRQEQRPATAPLALSEAQIMAINAAVEQLNIPWAELFQLLEVAVPDNVALLALQPEGRKRLLLVQAEAKSDAHMLAFVDRLRQQEGVAQAFLSKHEIRDQDPNHPYRFSVELRWQPGL